MNTRKWSGPVWIVMIGSLSGTGFSGSTTEAAYYFDGVRSASGGMP